MNSRNLWKVTRLIVAIAAVINVFWAWRVWNIYYQTLPRAADPAIGRTYSDSFHGITLYETREEHLRLELLQYSSDTLIAVSLLAAALHQWKSTRTDPEANRFDNRRTINNRKQQG